MSFELQVMPSSGKPLSYFPLYGAIAVYSQHTVNFSIITVGTLSCNQLFIVVGRLATEEEYYPRALQRAI